MNSRRRLRNHVFVWDRKFATRQEQAYRKEDIEIEREPHETALDAFFQVHKSRLDPPQYNYIALRKFLADARENDIVRPSPFYGQQQQLALVNDRRDITAWVDVAGNRKSACAWDGYSKYPPQGENVWLETLNAHELYTRLKMSRQEIGAERRIIYIANMTSTYALAIASSASELQAPLLREFLQRYVSYRVFFNVSMPFSGYSMEFHLPYYALRQSAIPYRDSRPLRRCGRFITTRNTGLPEYLYEAQISVIVTGFDEWFWTAYCCTDTYFGSEKNIHFYHDGGPSGYDAPGGGDRPNHDPIWNPREYFLNVLSRRFRQITKEWSIVVYTIEDRLQFHEASIFYDKIHPFDGAKREASLVDDAKFSRTKEFTWIVELLRLLHNALTKTIESWENFEEGEIQYFQVEDKDILRMDWSRYLEGIEKDMAELRLLRTSLHQKIEMFDNKRNGLVNASVMVESRDATDQGRNIGLLTRVTVAYLPLSLGTGIFSMVIMPKQANWEAYALLLIFLAFLTLAIAFRSHAMKATAMGSWQWLKRAVTERF